ncbi:hypothetical protein F5Y06DRAFT_304622 [Hypoxylon sp. FL0890]|nr:hypothetical protein F5Y06DRAFT_304622 [Hypoxylon sp. FL0890]
MSETPQLPALWTTTRPRSPQPASSDRNGRSTATEDPNYVFGSMETLFSTFDGDFATPSTPPSETSRESKVNSDADLELEPFLDEAASTSDYNSSPSRARDIFELDSNEPAQAQSIYGHNGKYQASAEAVVDDEHEEDELVILQRVRRRRPAFAYPQHQAVVAEVKSTADKGDDLNPFGFNNIVQADWFGPSGIRQRYNVQEQGAGGWEIIDRLDEVKQSSRRYEPRPTYENGKKKERIQDKIWPRKEGRESICRKYVGRGWQKVKNVFKRERSQVFELKDLPKRRLRSEDKGKERAREPATTLPRFKMAMNIERDPGPSNGFASSSTVPLRHSQGYGEDEAIAGCSKTRNEAKQFSREDFDPVLLTPVTQLHKRPKSGHWFSGKL